MTHQPRRLIRVPSSPAYSRGNIRLLDVDQIEQGACECYGTVKGHYERMVAN
jgi:hypothetical protein